MGVTDERDVTKLIEQGQTFARLLGCKDVLELLQAHWAAVTQVNTKRIQGHLVGQLLEPLHVLIRDHARMTVERLSSRLVVVRVVHAPRYSRVMVAEDGV